jgi:hypothetical protein
MVFSHGKLRFFSAGALLFVILLLLQISKYGTEGTDKNWRGCSIKYVVQLQV